MSIRPPLHKRLFSLVSGSKKDGPAQPPSAELGAAPIARVRRHAPSGRIPKLPSARILIIDDDAYVATALKRLLRQHDVHIALNGADALAHLRAMPCDVVLSDVMMPRPSGLDVYRTLAQEGSPLVQRFIFITGGAHDREARWFLRTISNTCLSKPADPEELCLAIDAVLQRHPGGAGFGSGNAPA